MNIPKEIALAAAVVGFNPMPDNPGDRLDALTSEGRKISDEIGDAVTEISQRELEISAEKDSVRWMHNLAVYPDYHEAARFPPEIRECTTGVLSFRLEASGMEKGAAVRLAAEIVGAILGGRA